MNPRGDRVGVLAEMQKRSSKLRAPLVGVSTEIGDFWERIGFCGVSGIDFELFECRWGKGLISLAVGKIAATSVSSSVGATFLFLIFVIGVAAMGSTKSISSIIVFAALFPFETLVNASIPLDLDGKDEALLGTVDSFRRFVAVGMVKEYN